MHPPRPDETMKVDRRSFLQVGTLAGLGITATNTDGAETNGETLYNGIRLPAVWPPRQTALTPEPMQVPYLEKPPSVLPIDVGRQLFVDDFLIEHSTLRRTFHTARYHPACPVLRPAQPWEQTAPNPCAM